ncbi:MAG: DUF1800 domain-containing protein [Acidobacteria bacterium]|nr:DUF1800 domain-containing protein [Acidobacteriota bacterium]
MASSPIYRRSLFRSSISALTVCGLLLCGCGSGMDTSSGGGNGSGGGSGGGGGSTPAATVTAAARLLDQTSFGPTTDSIAHVQTVGLQGYLKEQFALPATTLPAVPATLPAQCSNTPVACVESEFWEASLTANDQLRQRVALALSEQWVTSTQSVNGNAVLAYYNVLLNDAFSNWRTIMEDVTLSPSMGLYLNMLNSAKAPAGQIANENFAREMMQLFSTGLYMLNDDGTEKKDANGNSIPVYTEAQVQAFAKAYTGWTYAAADGSSPANFPNRTVNYTSPMAPVESAHDMTQKTLLNGTVIPAGGSARNDLKIALDNIFAHENLPPFVCRQLIQHLVTSTPSDAYVARVAAVFRDNGKGVRGDMKAVLTAILMDTEARAGDTNSAYDGGHLREPIFYITSVMRALGYSSTITDPANLWRYTSLSTQAAALGEEPLRSASVFNFFPPEYVIPETTLNAPEFSLENTASVTLRLTLADKLATNKLSNFKTTAFSSGGTLYSLAGSPGDLVDTLGVMFLHGQMPSNMRTTIVNAITGISDPATRARVATYLVMSSSQYKVMH